LKNLVEVSAVERVGSPFCQNRLSPSRGDIRVKLPPLRPFLQSMSCGTRMLDEDNRDLGLAGSGEECANSGP
jgi:hypothetical protein